MIKKNKPLTDNLGQISHQTVHTSEGGVVDLDEIQSDVIDSTGLSILPDDERRIEEIKKAISLDYLIETFNDNAHRTLLNLLALQDNQHPLKKGGIKVAYRTDVLIMHCKMNFTADENIVFDAILGTMSSFPDEKSYKIEPSTFIKYSKYAKSDYIYNVFSNGANKLKERHLIFDNLGDDLIAIPWFNILRYHSEKGNNKEKSSYIEFVPTDFFKDLALCSHLVHGAYGTLEVTTQLQGKYTIALYWFLENKKTYKEYYNATEGVFRMSIEDLKYQFSIPETYTTNDIKRRVLEPAKKSINSVNECDFTFDFKPQKIDGKISGYLFTIKPKKHIEEVKPKAIEKKDALEEQIKTFIEAFQLDFSDDEIHKIYLCAKKLSKDAISMSQILIGFKQRLDDKKLEPIEDKLKYLCKMMIQESGKSNTANNFNKFKQNGYNYAEIEDKLLDN